MAQNIPSLFRSAKNKKFNYEPWYYDPIKEEIEQRTSRIKKEMKLEEDATDENHIPFSSGNIHGAFKKGSTRPRDKSGILRIIILLYLVGGFTSYWYFGKDSVYFLLLLLPVYFLIKKLKLL